MRITSALLLALLLVLMPACQMNERLSGTMFGAVGGGVIGGVAGGAGGAVIGAVAGAVVGYLIGDYTADQRERGRGSVFGSTTDPVAPPAPASMAARRTTSGGGLEVAPASHTTFSAVHAQAKAAYDRGRAARTSTEARLWYQKAMSLDPTRPEPYNALALTELAAGNQNDALRLLRKAVQVDPDYAQATYNLKRLRSEMAAGR